MSPLASRAVAGQTILRPGVWRNAASGFCEWKGPPRTYPPDGPRTTIGVGSPARYRAVAT